MAAAAGRHCVCHFGRFVRAGQDMLVLEQLRQALHPALDRHVEL